MHVRLFLILIISAFLLPINEILGAITFLSLNTIFLALPFLAMWIRTGRCSEYVNEWLDGNGFVNYEAKARTTKDSLGYYNFFPCQLVFCAKIKEENSEKPTVYWFTFGSRMFGLMSNEVLIIKEIGMEKPF